MNKKLTLAPSTGCSLISMTMMDILATFLMEITCGKSCLNFDKIKHDFSI